MSFNSVPRIVSVGTANPPHAYSQDTVAEALGLSSAHRRMFTTSGIDNRFLCLESADELRGREDQGALLARHRRWSLQLGRAAIARCLESLGAKPRDIEYLCCVSSTGFMMPGLSAMFIRHCGLSHACHRVDVVGMGCNAALNGLNAVAHWASAHPGRIALMVCCEVNSAIHVRDDRVVTAVVNSLFGDGCGVLAISAAQSEHPAGPGVLAFQSHIVPSAWRAISYDWSSTNSKFELFLDKDIPALLGAESPYPVEALLTHAGLTRHDVSHWLVHAGGKKVITAIGRANDLSDHSLRHSTEVLRRFGNLSSATIIFSYQQLISEMVAKPGEYGVIMTMGPGATIETALLQW